MDNHDQIRMKLEYFTMTKKIPNIIFHGPAHSGKRTILNNFLQSIYNNPVKMKSQIMTVDCCHGKGIKFIREDLKFFAKTHIQSNYGTNFKSIVLLNADCLTIDAQSALRRCIELFSHNTRFFIIVENKERLLNPILSRFCEIYVSPRLSIKNQLIDHEDKIYAKYKEYYEQYFSKYSKEFLENQDSHNIFRRDVVAIEDSEQAGVILTNLANQWYNHGYSAKDWIDCIQKDGKITDRIILIQMCYYKIKPDYRCEQFLIYYLLYFFFVCSKEDLENMLL